MQKTIAINFASLTELMRFPGIGINKALLIFGNRPFVSFENILQIKGIGQVTFNKLIPYLCPIDGRICYSVGEFPLKIPHTR